MSALQFVVVAMCLMGISFAICIKLLFDAFIVHLQRQSDLTGRAIAQAGDAIALNGKILAILQTAADAKALESSPDFSAVEATAVSR